MGQQYGEWRVPVCTKVAQRLRDRERAALALLPRLLRLLPRLEADPPAVDRSEWADVVAELKRLVEATP